MINIKSKTQEIIYHIAQLKGLVMNDDELAVIKKFLSLEKILNDESVKELIAEDLQDDSWIEKTSVLIGTCYKRSEKSFMLSQKISFTEDFLVYRFIEDKLLKGQEITIKFIDKNWEFFEEDNTKWFNSKFMSYYLSSGWPKTIESLLKNNELTINKTWLYKNRELFFTNDVFEDINVLINKQKIKNQNL